MIKLTEAKVREIANAKGLEKYTIEECRATDQWIKEYALTTLHHHELKSVRQAALFRSFAESMVDLHYGSVEVDDLLMKLNCYPKWLRRSK